jgi:hypothetical protein
MRPSEVAAVRCRNVNTRTGTIQVERSRHLGSEAAPKTQRARRAIRLTRQNLDVLRPLIEVKGPDDYLFENVRGQPIEPANFYDLFRDAQRALGITPLRDLYSTKDTYISLALTSGVSLTWLSEQTGVAVATILKHYGRSCTPPKPTLSSWQKLQERMSAGVLNLHSSNTGVQSRNALLRKTRNFPRKVWRPRRDLNPCYRRERWWESRPRASKPS